MGRGQEDCEGGLLPRHQGLLPSHSLYRVLLICRVAATQVMWVSSPLSLLFAQKFLSPEVCDHALSLSGSPE